MKNRLLLQYAVLLLGILLGGSSLKAQQIVSYDVDFNSGTQNMWGPSFSPFNINQEITLFEEDWNIPINLGGITDIAGFDFGATLNGSFSGLIGSKVSLNGFTTGTVEVNYPIDVTLDMTADNTYDQGDSVVVRTSYEVDPNYELQTNYPSVGEAKLDVYFQLAAGVSANICFFSCTSFPIIPSFNTGVVNLNIVTANANGVWFLGPADWFQPDLPGTAGWPFSKPPKTSAPFTPPSCVPWQCHIPAFPAELPDVGYGITGEITIPYVETDDNLVNGTDLTACGDSTYFNLNLEIFQLLGNFIPGPAGIIIGNLSGSQSLGPAEVSWNFFSASFDANLTNNQCFDFTPKVWGRYQFPVPVDYRIYDPATGTYTAQATSSIINVELGKDLHYKFPCYFEEVNITPTYFIDGSVDNFRNHTYDEISFDFLMSALEFGIEVPSVTIIPGFTIPEICFTIGYPCGWFDWCTSSICTPEIVIPPVVSPNIDLSFGPLWSTTIPIGSISYDWVDISWNLEGFQELTMSPFKMIASPLQITNTQTDVSCYGGNDGSINVTTSALTPSLPYVFSWTNGATTEDITTLTAGAYELSVIDNHGCQFFTGATIMEPTHPLSIEYTKTDKSCNGGVNDGTISTLVSGGTAPYGYSWSNGGTTAAINGLNAGTYTLTVTDAKGCQTSISVTIDQPLIFGQTAAVTNVSCFGGSNGSIDADVFGGVIPYTYSWTGGYATQDISAVPAANYTLTVTDGNGCVSAQSYTVTEPATAVAIAATGTDVDCKGNLTGAVDATTSGGTPGYTYLWVNGQGVVMPFTSEDIASVGAGSYTVYVTDANGCMALTSHTITQPAQGLASQPVIVNVNCFGDATGSIDPVISGGTPVYSYTWSDASNGSTLNAITAGNYTLDVQDAQGCTASFAYTVTQPAAGLSLTLTPTDVLCFGMSTGSVQSAVAGGTAPYDYLWNTGFTTGSIQSLPAGNYDLDVTDAKGCIISASTTVNQPTAPLALSTTVVDVDCYNNTTGSVDLTATGGTTPYDYQWSTSGTLILADTTQDISNLPDDNYTVLVTDAHGCQETTSATVSQPAAPLQLTGLVDDVNCFAGTDGAVDITVTGGTTGYTYAWSNSAISEDINGIAAGGYDITVTDANACEVSGHFDVAQPNAGLVITTVIKDALCNGGATGSVDATVSGGTTPYVYSWSNGAVTQDLLNLTAGVYTLTVTDAQGCTSFTGAVVGEPAQALVVTPVVTDVSCYGLSDGQIVVNITGGMQPYYFNWGNQNEYLLNNPSETLSDLIVGDYFIRVKDRNGCINEQIVSVSQPNPIVIDAAVYDALCNGDASGAIDLTVTGGTTPYVYQWTNGSATEDISALLAGEYTYVVTDANNCSTSERLIVEEPAPIQIVVQEIPVTCVDQADAALFITPYGGTMPYIFDWSTGSIAQNAEGLKPGDYWLIITDANSCTQTFDFVINENNDECLFIPNTITPNGDDYNDTWVIRNIDLYPNAEIKIFNKWGNELFSSKGEYTPWNGTYNGEPLPSEVYYYIIVLGNEEDNQYTGTITIIR